MHIPATQGELIDLLSWMILAAPEFRSWSSDTGDIESAFRGLRKGIKNIRSEIGEKGVQELCNMADQARRLYGDGDLNEGGYRLHEMQLYIRLRGWVSEDWRSKIGHRMT